MVRTAPPHPRGWSMTSKVDIWNMALDYIGESDPIQDEDDDRPATPICVRHWDKCLKEVLEARWWPWARREVSISEIGVQIATADYADAVSPYDTFTIPFPFSDTEQLEVVHIDAAGAETTLEASTDYTLNTDDDEDVDPTLTLTTALAVDESLRITVTTERVGWEHVYSLPGDCVVPRAILINGMRSSLYDVAGRPEFAIMLNDAGDGRILCCDIAPGSISKLEYTALVTKPSAYSGHFTEALAWRLAIPLALALPKDAQKAQWCRTNYRTALSEASALEAGMGNDLVRQPSSPSELERE